MDHNERAHRALNDMNTAIAASNWGRAICKCRIVIRWLEATYPTESKAISGYRDILAGLIRKYHATRRWWHWPWP